MNAKKIIYMLLIGTAMMSLFTGCGTNTEESGAGSNEMNAGITDKNTGISEKMDSTKKKADNTEKTAQNGTDKQKDASETEDSADTEVKTTGSSNTLVVYYSATGNTKAVADAIAEAANADVFELEPVQPYSDADLDWTDDNSRVTREHENEDERVVELTEETVDNWDSYDKVFIGYPIWWGIAAWPVDGFIKANDFTGKTVIPFCTATSSGIGESGELLQEMVGTGNWLEDERFRSGTSTEDIQSWMEGLGL